MDAAPSSAPAPEEQFSIPKIQALLGTNDDTSRFVGLALLKTLLDNSEQLRGDEATITALWEAISPKFLDRLIKTASHQPGRDEGAGESNKPPNNSRDMLDLAVSVLHTFVSLLPQDAVRHKRVLGRIPQLVSCLLNSSEDTTRLVLETLLTLVSQPEGARSFNNVDDLTPLTEIAPSHHIVLKILEYAWLSGMAASADKSTLAATIDKTIGNLISSFKGTDAVTLLDFLAELLRRLDDETLPQNPEWMPAIRVFIQNLIRSRPTAAGRAAWTNLAAALLELYPEQAPRLLFLDDSSPKGKGKANGDTATPFSYVMISLLLVDLRASLPSLLEKLNSPEYKPISTRLASAFYILSNFIGYLMRALDDDDLFTKIITPDLLLKLRTSISETMSLTLEYLRDRWDASVAGAMGLHPDSREATVHSSTGSHLALAWDAKGDNVTEDLLIEAAIMALAIWLREDDGETLRREATGLTDMFVELYRTSSSTTNPIPTKPIDFRRPILAALEGTLAEPDGVEAFLSNDGWAVLADDLVAILQHTSSSPILATIGAASRGLEIVRILLPVAEAEQPGPRPEWLDVVTRVSAVYIPTLSEQKSYQLVDVKIVHEFQIAALQLATSLLANSHRGVQRRYVHTMGAILGVASAVKGNVQKILGVGSDGGKDERGLLEGVDDVLRTVEGVRMAVQ